MKDYNYGDIALDDLQFSKNSCDQEIISFDEGFFLFLQLKIHTTKTIYILIFMFSFSKNRN